MAAIALPSLPSSLQDKRVIIHIKSVKLEGSIKRGDCGQVDHFIPAQSLLATTLLVTVTLYRQAGRHHQRQSSEGLNLPFPKSASNYISPPLPLQPGRAPRPPQTPFPFNPFITQRQPASQTQLGPVTGGGGLKREIAKFLISRLPPPPPPPPPPHVRV